jgi:glyoxylase-like metal-dependent hydrolase (beta-lactamase superfamily II)
MTGCDMTTRIQVTGAAQREAWRGRVLPPVEQVRPGLWSVPVPIPFSPLRYTLCYAFTGDSGVVIVDPGWDSADGRQAFAAGLAAAGATPRDVAGVVVTHVHPDHHGLSNWVREESGAWIAMHSAEAETLPARIVRGRKPGSDPDWLRGHGVPEEDVDVLVVDPALMTGVLSMPGPDRLVADGERLPIPGRDVRAVWTPGHTPGHLCLHDAAAGVLLTGDHLLPRISPNISVHGPQDADPLTDYLASLARTGAFTAEEALPAHEYRFRGLDIRSAALMAHHRDRGAEIMHVIDRLGQPTAWAIATQLTWSRGWDWPHGVRPRLRQDSRRRREDSAGEPVVRNGGSSGYAVTEPSRGWEWKRRSSWPLRPVSAPPPPRFASVSARGIPARRASTSTCCSGWSASRSGCSAWSA